MKKVITLREAAEKLAEQGYEIKWDRGSSLEDFFSYFDCHYRSILSKLEEEWCGAEDARRFLASDILKIFE